jgi:hypothetical protein
LGSVVSEAISGRDGFNSLTNTPTAMFTIHNLLLHNMYLLSPCARDLKTYCWLVNSN